MEYLLNCKFEILCSENFLIPKLNKKYNYMLNKVTPYNTKVPVDINKCCKISEKDVECIRKSYYSKQSTFLSPKEMDWLYNYYEVKDKLDLFDDTHVRIIFYSILLNLMLLKIPSNIAESFTKKALNTFIELDSYEKKKELIDTINSNFKEFFKVKEFWYVIDDESLKLDQEFFNNLALTIKNSIIVDNATTETEYLKLCSHGVVHKVFELNKSKTLYTKGLSLDEQKKNLLLVNSILTTKMGDNSVKKNQLNDEQINKFISFYARLEKILLISMEEWV
ncbi:hypothetical protein [Clostridium sp.]|uniref:hypothetical protein n=1 Tax=Clostridium sp. TaxID=1506 RepID=UPI001B4FD0A3|nr:hypothetical protein [Clostridium sp.]MBP3914979.1 hypothetical protein [Clostridium sp.]